MLTDRQCVVATSEGKGIRKLKDDDGLFLWIFADGRKYWRFRYWRGGKEKLLALGVYPEVSLKHAREKRSDARAILRADGDPVTERKLDKARARIAAANSFEAVALEWLAKQKQWSEKHREDVDRRLRVNLFKDIGDRAIAAIAPPELLEVVRKIEHRGATDLAHRVLAQAGQVFRYAVATGRRTNDPTQDLRGALTPHIAGQQAAVKPVELPALMKAIATYDLEIGDRATRLALELLALTFVRTNELIGAEQAEFDGDVWTIPASRMKGEEGHKREHVVPLSRQAVATVDELRILAGRSRFLLPGRSREKPISENTMLFALYRLGYKGKMTGHGFRAVASTILNESGAHRPDVIEIQLAHVDRNQVRSAYNRALYLPERRAMMQWWADYLDRARAEQKVRAIASKRR